MIDIDDRARAIAQAEGMTFVLTGRIRDDMTVRLGFGTGPEGMGIAGMLVTAACLISMAQQLIEVAAKDSGQSVTELWAFVQTAQKKSYPTIDRSAAWWRRAGGDR